MSLLIKSEPDIVELSSDEESMALLSNGPPNTEHGSPNTERGPPNAEPGPPNTERPSTPDTQCSICLDDLTNKCYSNSCWHLFCFECLKRWSISEPTCPLCKKAFNFIYHSFNDLGVHETYNVPLQARAPSFFRPRIFIRPYSEMTDDVNRMNLFMDIVRRNERMINNIHYLYDPDYNHNDNGRLFDANQDYSRPTLQRPIMGQATRIRVYVENAWAEPLPDLSGRFRDCSSAFYRNNPAQTYRLHAFILRDLVAIRETARIEGEPVPLLESADVSVTNLIMRSLSAYEIREIHMINILRPFLFRQTTHFCHELYNFANSPYDIVGYDRHVQYSFRTRYSPSSSPPYPVRLIAPNFITMMEPPPTALPIPAADPSRRVIGETIVLDSDNEEAQLPILEVIVVSSSGDDSDVEILSHSFRSIEARNPASIDQPSTSTGIRHSLDRPNNRYNLRRRRLLSPTISDSSSFIRPHSSVHGMPRVIYPSHARRRRPSLDSSSDDEELITATRSSQATRAKSKDNNNKKKRKPKKNKNKKRKLNNDSRSEIRSTNRSRSYSGSSSSSGDTDIRPNHSHTDIIL
ncbi:E3 ubiquitin-protein ligase Topors isoform X3 [Rhopalosiphum maidis]|uniref:E3 ubiquitin-protein ligase Topors isoform X3 n=1 Tax=Rhopalosiphum maidis TaxID=43146 RepID=UPI000EFE9492|nr:E3 ubiquitin-protein ligase Topors isoform X3 [Rhopalosiphum maidis]